MSFTLMDLGSENYEFRANVWNWTAALEVIRSFEIVSDGKIRKMRNNATGTAVSQEEAHLIAKMIIEKTLPALEPDKRIFADLSITDQPDDGTLYRDEDEKWKNYSANFEWMKEFSEFCGNSKGFRVY